MTRELGRFVRRLCSSRILPSTSTRADGSGTEAQLIRQLREKSSAPMKDVKAALIQCDWNVKAAKVHPRRTLVKDLLTIVMSLSNVKEEIYSALDEWAAFELEFPVVPVRKALDTLKKRRQWLRILQVSKWMISKGQGQTLGTYDLMLKAYDMTDRLEDAEKLWEKIVPLNARSTPKIMFSHMMSIYRKRDMLEKSLKVFEQMINFGIKPNKKTAGHAGEAYYKLGMPEKKEMIIKKYLSPVRDARKSKRKKKRTVQLLRVKNTGSHIRNDEASHVNAAESNIPGYDNDLIKPEITILSRAQERGKSLPQSEVDHSKVDNHIVEPEASVLNGFKEAMQNSTESVVNDLKAGSHIRNDEAPHVNPAESNISGYDNDLIKPEATIFNRAQEMGESLSQSGVDHSKVDTLAGEQRVVEMLKETRSCFGFSKHPTSQPSSSLKQQKCGVPDMLPYSKCGPKEEEKPEQMKDQWGKMLMELQKAEDECPPLDLSTRITKQQIANDQQPKFFLFSRGPSSKDHKDDAMKIVQEQEMGMGLKKRASETEYPILFRTNTINQSDNRMKQQIVGFYHGGAELKDGHQEEDEFYGKFIDAVIATM